MELFGKKIEFKRGKGLSSTSAKQDSAPELENKPNRVSAEDFAKSFVGREFDLPISFKKIKIDAVEHFSYGHANVWIPKLRIHYSISGKAFSGQLVFLDNLKVLHFGSKEECEKDGLPNAEYDPSERALIEKIDGEVYSGGLVERHNLSRE